MSPPDENLPPPNGGPPFVAMLCTRGMEAFLSNALHGMLRSGVGPGQILIACPADAEDAVRHTAWHHSPDIRVVTEPSLPASSTGQYSSFGSASFNEICWSKIALVRRLIETHDHVVYADLDIGWLRNPLPYLAQVAGLYPIAFQTEGLPRFPPAICCGFISLRRSDRTIAFLDALLAQWRPGDDGGVNDDQTACQQMIEREPAWLRDIYLLPESLFANGLFYRNLQAGPTAPIAMEGRLQPFLFHANWTIGLDNKRALLAAAGCWFGDDAAELAAANEANAGAGSLIAVIYPVHDVRGDVAEHCRCWTEQQQVAPESFQVIVVADAGAALDEAALRRVMRPWDVLLRVKGASQDTELWNVGARAAKSPWLLFVEAHGWPEQDALAALAAWIEANPGKSACNFQIKNPDDHPVARLMKRWFAQTQQNWASPSTWRRVHRTAFALRRDAFEQVGPIDPFGQFGPPLLSARMHRRNIAITTLPTSGLLHDDARDIGVHIHDTADYARGELAARSAAKDPEFFENYFGPSPFHGPRPILSADSARSLMRGLLIAAMRRRSRVPAQLRQACHLLPSALTDLPVRIAVRKARIRIDAFALTKLPLSRRLSWWRFIVQHHDIVAVEQMRWVADHPLPPVTQGQSIPALALARHALIGLHALEYLDATAFRWTHPALLLRLAAGRKVTVTLETRNLRPGLEPSHLDAVTAAGGTVDITRDDAGNIRLRFETPAATSGVADVVLIAPELVEPAIGGQPGRCLGLPLFGVTVEFR